MSLPAALLAAACLACAGAQFLAPYSCDTPVLQTQINFNLTLFAGSGPWHEVQRVVEGEGLQGACANASVAHDASAVTAAQLGVLYGDVWAGGRREYGAVATRSLGESAARFMLTAELAGLRGSFPFYVLTTDYDSYALVFVCRPINTTNSQVFLSKISRSENLTDTASASINSYLQGSVPLNGRSFVDVNRTEHACSSAASSPVATTFELLGFAALLRLIWPLCTMQKVLCYVKIKAYIDN